MVASPLKKERIIIMKNAIRVNRKNKTIEMSNATYKKSCIYGTTEYNELNAVMNDFPTFEIKIVKSDKTTYWGLTFEKMEDYIKTQFEGEELEERLNELHKVESIADAKNGKYPLTKKWFLEKYPEYKKSEIKTNENGTNQ